MSNEFNWDVVSTENNGRPFINLNPVEEGSTTLSRAITFEEDAPFTTTTGKFGEDKHIFKVQDEDGNPSVWSTSSKRCMAGLKEHLPLAGKTLIITRTGTGYDTEYTVEEA